MRLKKIAINLIALGSAFQAFAQSPSDLVGTWSMTANYNVRPDGTRTDLFGPSPLGQITFDGAGNFTTLQMRSDLPKVATNNRMTATDAENKAIVQGAMAYFGRYTIQDKILVMSVSGSTFPNWIGTDQKRLISSFASDEMVTINQGAAVGGSAETHWKKLK